jgi:5-methylcytosine-specific restriction protein A
MSPPGMAAAGLCVVESLVPVKPPMHRPPGAKSAAQMKTELDRLRPSATRRGYGARWRRARAAYLARHPLCVPCRRLVGSSRRRWSTTWCHIGAVR